MKIIKAMFGYQTNHSCSIGVKYIILIKKLDENENLDDIFDQSGIWASDIDPEDYSLDKARVEIQKGVKEGMMKIMKIEKNYDVDDAYQFLEDGQVFDGDEYQYIKKAVEQDTKKIDKKIKNNEHIEFLDYFEQDYSY
ncbi:MAG: hypothetical protein EU547_05970 [Promethearchaeota archaeon]|nr:MAG: hypothetical protein EU547_05970 [Candidatus Lokiarchaeota archaeon]